MKQNIRLIALDLDGTTLNSQKQLTKRTKEAILQAIEAGIQIVVATGRTFSSLAPEIMEISGISCAITSNGAVVNRISDGNILYQNDLAPETVAEITQKIQIELVDTEVCRKGSAYIGQDYYERILNGKTNRDISYVKATRHPVPDIYEFMMEHSAEIENINLNFADMEEKRRWQKLLQSISGITQTSSFLFNIELGGEHTSKAQALRYLIEKEHLSPNEAAAFGDSENDLEMIKMAGIGVAMANAVEAVRKAADRVTSSNDQDGVAIVIEELLQKRVEG